MEKKKHQQWIRKLAEHFLDADHPLLKKDADEKDFYDAIIEEVEIQKTIACANWVHKFNHAKADADNQRHVRIADNQEIRSWVVVAVDVGIDGSPVERGRDIPDCRIRVQEIVPGAAKAFASWLEAFPIFEKEERISLEKLEKKIEDLEAQKVNMTKNWRDAVKSQNALAVKYDDCSFCNPGPET